ncbi:MAG TPA: hypothetical protein VFC23_19665 [Thermoanaerobaculia bacterium]|nr:hypothetical protein [Thermoanaerobaculia bacterium]
MADRMAAGGLRIPDQEGVSPFRDDQDREKKRSLEKVLRASSKTDGRPGEMNVHPGSREKGCPIEMIAGPASCGVEQGGYQRSPPPPP